MISRHTQSVLLLCLLPAFLPAFSAKPAQADDRYVFDKAHTSILFSVSRFGIFEINGEFRDYDGHFVFCVQHPRRDSIDITFYSAGIHTMDEWTDEQLRSPDFFDAARYPSMHFVSTSVKLIDKDNATITGNLTLRGVTKPVTLEAHFTAKDDDPDDDGDYVVGFSATGVLNRSDFGMTSMTPLIGDEVKLLIQVNGIQEK